MSRDKDYLSDILIASRRALGLYGELTLDRFKSDWKAQDLICAQFIRIGEATKRLSSGFRRDHPEIRWQEIAGLRDILIHQYDRIDYDAIWAVLQKDLPQLVEYITPLIPGDE